MFWFYLTGHLPQLVIYKLLITKKEQQFNRENILCLTKSHVKKAAIYKAVR